MSLSYPVYTPLLCAKLPALTSDRAMRFGASHKLTISAGAFTVKLQSA